MGFRDILGHERQIGLLSSAIRRDKVHHAWLFSGPTGIGRRTVALTFARALNCERADGEACDECLSCRKLLAGTHPDLQILGQDRTELQIKIDEVREKIIRFVSYKVFEGRFRIILILEAERMNNATANALLKTLEEPPKQTVFILTAANLNALLPTIRSRCQKVRFSPIDDRQLAEWLERNHGLPAEQAFLQARLSEGSVGRALALTPEQLAGRQAFLTTVLKVGTGNAYDPVHLAEQLAGDKTTLFTQLSTLESFLRDAAVRQQSPGTALRNADLEEPLSDFAQRVSFLSLQRLLSLLWEVRGATKLNINPQLALERLLLELAQVQKASHAAASVRA